MSFKQVVEIQCTDEGATGGNIFYVYFMSHVRYAIYVFQGHI